MAHYTTEETIEMIENSDIELESESEIEDPKFPLPSLLSDNEDPVVAYPVEPTCTQPTTPSQGFRPYKYT